MTNDLAIQASGLVKSYGSRVLDGVDLSVEPGSVFALLGPNGAGKTTTVRILSTLTRADAGTARVAGYDVVADRSRVRRSISLTGQYAAVDELQTGFENLRMMGRLARLSRRDARARAAELLERFDLVEAGRRRVATYSGGLRRRLDLATGLVAQPSIIFLDEPTTGLDPRSRQAMWQVITGLVTTGATVFLTTQYLDEADHLADHIAVVDDGRIVAQGTAAELKAQVTDQRLRLATTGSATFDEVRRQLAGQTLATDPARFTIDVATDGSARHIRSLLDAIDPTGAYVARFSVHTATLDDVFMALTGHATTSRTRPTPPTPKTGNSKSGDSKSGNSKSGDPKSGGSAPSNSPHSNSPHSKENARV